MQNDAVFRKPATILATFVLGLLIATCRETPRRPLNVLLITVDTFRADRVGSNTRTLAGLAREGVRFDAADSPVPLTLPAHASLMSGLLPLHHGLRNNGVGAFPAARQTLATAFGSSYRTGAFVGSFILDHRFGLDRGFERYDDEIVRNVTDSSGTFEAERRGSEVVDRALAWLRQNDARPFFAWVHLYDAHAPYAPPPPYPQTYDGEVAYVDAQIARLLAAVDRGNTIIAVVGDHGEALGEHGELTHGLLLYEPTLHVPMIIAAPALAARVITTPVSTIDLAPTIASLAGVAFTAADGRDLDLRNGREPQPSPMYAETQYPATFGWSELASMRVASTKLISGPAPELYDLQHDPGETVNVLTNQRRAYRALSTRLDQLRATAVASSLSTVDAETRAKLASLGYVAPTQSTGGTKRDPKTVAPLFRAFEEATAMLNAGRARDAAASLEQLMRDDPTNHVFRETLARALRQSGEVARAIALYRQAVALAPNDADAWYNLAVALQESGNAREGAIALAEAAKRDPNRPEIHNIRGTALAEAGNLAEAEKEFRATIAADARNARAYNNLGNVLSAMNRHDDAAGAYQKSIELAPRYADPLNGLGAMLVSDGHARDALPYFDRALRAAPDYYEAQLNRAVALQMSGDSAGAAAELQRLLARLPARHQYDSERNTARTFLGRLPPQFRR
ncbi:MAG TPA: sulfatase-like hydrolase/transferase [Thermoanaerobaculia bacterium]|jgi:arylsulfatase A-like enzyme/cytochrome c-type biogenesis protein CcmH/NrfG|nr:sulfatase-like hydrolase/transferase [Thermoanaerobaculia bacterium]